MIMEIGNKCTVGHHYGHTDVKKVMTITKIHYNQPSFSSGISVMVDLLPYPIDSGLINLIEDSNALLIGHLLKDSSFTLFIVTGSNNEYYLKIVPSHSTDSTAIHLLILPIHVRDFKRQFFLIKVSPGVKQLRYKSI